MSVVLCYRVCNACDGSVVQLCEVACGETNDFSSCFCDACEFGQVGDREHSEKACGTVQNDGLNDTLI